MAKKTSRFSLSIGILLIVAALCGGAYYAWKESAQGKIVVDKIKSEASSLISNEVPALTPKQKSSNQAIRYKFAIISDSHEDTTYFPKIVKTIAGRTDLDFVAHLGDLTNAGEKDQLQAAKNVLDIISVPVYVIPGDHDLNWYPQHDLTNFKQVFSETRTSFSFDHKNDHFIFIDNSNLNTGIDDPTWEWLKSDLGNHHGQNIFVMMSTPISNPYLSFKAMGSQNDSVKQQAGQLGSLLAKYHTKAIFAGDTHTFSQYQDKNTGLPIVTVGAAGSTKNPLPMYVVVEIYTDGGYNVSSIPYSSAIPVSGED